MQYCFKYSDTYYSYCSEYKKYKEALEYVEEKLRCIRSSLSGLDDAVNRFYRSEITARSVSGRPKTAYNMCYLIAKKFKQVGSIALKVQHGKALSELSRRLTLETLDRDIQIITVSNLEAYREYAPYKIMKNQSEFETAVLAIQ